MPRFIRCLALLLPFALALRPALAAPPGEPAADTQVQIRVVFSEKAAGTAEPKMLGAPGVITRLEQKAQISVGQEDKVALGKVVEEFHSGIELTVTPSAGADFVLRGVATVTEASPKEAQPTAAWVVLRSVQVPYVVELKDGAAHELTLRGPGEPPRELTIKLTASRVKTENAATTYWQSFAALPVFSEAERKLLTTLPPGQGATQLVEKCSSALSLLQRATGMGRCDWALDYSLGPDLSLPHMSKARELQNVALLRAQLRLAGHDLPGATQDALASLRLARQVAQTPLLLTHLVGILMEQSALNFLAAMLPDLDEAEVVRVSEAVQQLPPAGTYREAMDAEGKYVLEWLEKTVADKGGGQPANVELNADQIGALYRLMEIAPGLPRKLPPGLTMVRLHRMVVRAQQDYQELSRLAELPIAEREPRAKDFDVLLRERKSILNENLEQGGKNLPFLYDDFLSCLAPPLGARTIARYTSLEVRRQLFLAALAVARSGESALANFPDPASPKQSIGFRRKKHGFELESKAGDLWSETLRVGRD